MLRYVFLLIVFAIGLPLVMITLGANETTSEAVVLDDGSFAEQEAPYSQVPNASTPSSPEDVS